ncbi:MAG: hypothetical protein AB8B78_11445 [Polaribacter sp.]
MKNSIYLIIVLTCLFSCKQEKQSNLANNPIEKPQLSIEQKHKKIVTVLPVFKKEVKDWEELKTVHSFLEKFETISSKEALVNALQLRDLTKSLKDSVKPKIFDMPSLNARINVFYNETLRLADLTFIPAATANDINLQIDKTLSTFSSINSKINTILSKKRFEDEVDVDFTFIGLDSTKIDTLTKTSINKIKADKLKKQEQLKKLKSKSTVKSQRPDQ